MVAAALADLEERVSRPLVLIMRHACDQGSPRAFCAISPGSRAASSRCRSAKSNGVPAETLAATARAIGIAADASDDVAGALGAHRDRSSSTRRRASSSPARSISPARCWRRTAHCRNNRARPRAPKRNGRLSPAVKQSDPICAVTHTAAVIHCSSFAFGAAPTWREAISPFLNSISVGIDMMLYFCRGLRILVDVELDDLDLARRARRWRSLPAPARSRGTVRTTRPRNRPPPVRPI